MRTVGNILKKYFASGLAVMLSCLLLSACSLDPIKSARYGNYAGAKREPQAEPPFDILSTKWDARWFPAYVRWAPDDSHLLVGLCHVKRSDFCRIAKYWLAEARWEVLSLQAQTTYRWPSYAPDGKNIVATVGDCDTQFRCSDSSYTLTLISSDGKRSTSLIKTHARYPNYAQDGKRIIYWRLTGGGGANVAMYDLSTGKEEALTQLLIWASDIRGAAYFLPDGNRFVFAGWLQAQLTTTGLTENGRAVFKDGKQVLIEPLKGTKLDRNGPNFGVIRYVADRRNGLITEGKLGTLNLLWPDNGISANNDGPESISSRGDVLYYCPVNSCIKRKVDSGMSWLAWVLPKQLGQKTGYPLLLRPADEAGLDLDVFVLRNTGAVVAISQNAKKLAFVGSNESIWDDTDDFGIIASGQSTPLLIDWPRLNLDSASVQFKDVVK